MFVDHEFIKQYESHYGFNATSELDGMVILFGAANLAYTYHHQAGRQARQQTRLWQDVVGQFIHRPARGRVDVGAKDAGELTMAIMRFVEAEGDASVPTFSPSPEAAAILTDPAIRMQVAAHGLITLADIHHDLGRPLRDHANSFFYWH
jgi:hypothetical protein